MYLLLLQIVVVVGVTMLCAWLATLLGQARVIGEIIGGILLGPSILGRLFPTASQHLFPKSSLGAMDELSTVGLILFLFTVGMELDDAQLRRQGPRALGASATSILIPFIAAAVLSHALRVRFAPHGIGSLAFVLFLGISMSITAFPVLARILEERRLSSTPLGTTAILCAAFDDAVAWLLLAVALTLVDVTGEHNLLLHFGLLAAYLGIMLGVIRPLAGRFARRRKHPDLTITLLGVSVAFAFASAAATDWAGVHPLFGAFIAGVCFPRVEAWQQAIRSRLETIASVLLLPLFFALTGLRTRLDLLNDARTWGWAGIILLFAIAGKVGGAVLAARWAGQGWREAWGLGALLNTRGLVELVVLNIAYNKGVFSPTLFTMLVVMALVTTMITTPLLDLLKIRGSESEGTADALGVT